MKKNFFVLLVVAAFCSFGFAKSVKRELPASWQNCVLDGFSYSSPFYDKTVGEIFDENNLITKENARNGGTFGKLIDFVVKPDSDFAIFDYELWVVANKSGMEGQLRKIGDVSITLVFLPEYETAVIYEVETSQASTGMTKTFTYDGYSYDEEMMAHAAESFMKMMIKVD